jgi:hypothetical protein
MTLSISEWLYPPFDFSSIIGFLNEFLDSDWEKHIVRFREHIDLTTLHVIFFMKFIS